MSEPADASTFSIAAAGQCHRFSHRAMACVWEVWIPGHPHDYAQDAAQAAFDEVDRLEEELSRFVQMGDVARINGLKEGQSVAVGADTFECLELAAKVHVDTSGAFDATVQSSPAARSIPCMELDRSTHRVTARTDRLHVDLGGIGKGYALDQMVRLLGDWSIEAAIIHSGQSTLYALGAAPQQAHWTVGIRNPDEQSVSLGYVDMRHQALAGSGMSLHGAHIVDPRTGGPAGGASGAWALANTAALADALSTAFMVMSGAEMDAYFARHPDVAGLRWIRDHGDGGAVAVSRRSSPSAASSRAITPQASGRLVRYGAELSFVEPKE